MCGEHSIMNLDLHDATYPIAASAWLYNMWQCTIPALLEYCNGHIHPLLQPRIGAHLFCEGTVPRGMLNNMFSNMFDSIHVAMANEHHCLGRTLMSWHM